MDTFIARISALLADNTPESVAKIREIEAILDRKTPVIGGMTRLLAELACDGYVNPNINDQNFLNVDPDVSIEGVRPVNIKKSWTEPEAVAYLKTLNPPMKPANLSKSMRWCATNPDYQRTHFLVCLVERWFVARKIEYVVYFGGDASSRDVAIDRVVDVWLASYEVLAEELAPGT